jgi:hypothetical protein
MAAGNTYVAIDSQTLSSAAATVTFSSIPGTYTDLVLVMNAKLSAGGAANDLLRVGAGSIDTGSNYSVTGVYGTGGTAGSLRQTSSTFINLDDITSTSFTVNIINFMNYANTTTYKPILFRSSAPQSNCQAFIGMWRSTSAINTIQITAGASTFVADSTFSIYGIASA